MSTSPISWKVLGASGLAYTSEELTRNLSNAEGPVPYVLPHHNLHSLYLCRRNEVLRRFYEMSQPAHIDGMAIVGICRLLGQPVGRANRITYVDWLPVILALAAERRWRVFFLGSTPEGAAAVERYIRTHYPEITFATSDGFFDASPRSTECVERTTKIAKFGADLLLVGMGMPRQELWILENGAECGAKRILPCGAAFDYRIGLAPVPPRWMGRMGLEWAFRLAVEPRRLARRYLVEPLYLAWPLMKELTTTWLGRHQSS